MFVASTNPLIVYYHDGFLKLSLHTYSGNSTEKGALVSNTDLQKKLFEQAAKGEKVLGMNETELRNYQTWTLPRLHDYLYKVANKTDDPNWLDNHLRKEIKRAMGHFMRATSHNFFPSSAIYELMGLDFTLDDNLNLWFIEGNTKPALIGYSHDRVVILTQMLTDIYEIVFGLLRSRMKRISVFLNKLSDVYGSDWEENLPEISTKYQAEYDELIKNRFEPEFEIDPKNSMELIIDYNLDGEEKFQGMIPEDCLFF